MHGKCVSRGHVWEPGKASPSSSWAVPLASSLPWHLLHQCGWGQTAVPEVGAWSGHRVRITSAGASGALHSPGVFGLRSGPKQEILSLCGQHRKGLRWSARVTVCRPSASLLSFSFLNPPGPTRLPDPMAPLQSLWGTSSLERPLPSEVPGGWWRQKGQWAQTCPTRASVCPVKRL